MPDSTVTINGRSYDWASLTVTGPQGVMVGYSEINWKSSQKKKRTYGKGLLPRGATRANYEASVDITVDYSEYGDLLSALDSGIFDSVFDIALVFEIDGEDRREVVLQGIMIDDKDDGAKNGDEELTIKLSGTAQMIFENGAPEYQEK